MAGAPYPKSAQLARQEKRYRRKVASPKMWARIAAEKPGPCRACGAVPPNELAHLVARAQGGPDAEFNIVPLCRACHVLFDARHSETCRTVSASLTDDEYAGLGALAGEAVFERRFGIRFEEVAR